MNPNVSTITSIDVIDGKVDGDFDKLGKILLDNYSNKIDNDSTTSRYEDTYCPPCPIVSHILDQITEDFYNLTHRRVIVDDCWGHIHEKNMSTNTHCHPGCFGSGVVYISVPKGSGSIVFIPNIDSRNRDAFRTSFPPERGRYYIFPSYLDHYVTRNESEEKRISLSFNFQEIK